MKAKFRQAVPKTAAGVNLSVDKAAIICEIMDKIGGHYRAVGKFCGSETVGYICGINGYLKNGQQTEINTEMIIFSGLDKTELDTVLVNMKNRKCTVPLKAVVTQHNRDWTVSALAEELSSEYEFMKNYRKSENNG